MLRPSIYESFESCRDSQLDLIDCSRKLIKAIQSTMKGKDDSLAKEVIQENRQLIKTIFAELKEMQRWYKKEGKNHGKGQRLLAETSST